ncbi:hypothetical protein CYMTET_24482 [Cymbomonas tetramitiformis]|uniref:EF-hand domain-containing protein n=1 Tax=Cymbomonas tetramitiformis TaxID=36881 RepID=A0AAE0FW91_9CHLO|nr:hypothetical protein CYMTET_24482 [Cymbomonas tetramitiformis]
MSHPGSISHPSAAASFRALDRDNNGCLSFSEYLQAADNKPLLGSKIPRNSDQILWASTLPSTSNQTIPHAIHRLELAETFACCQQGTTQNQSRRQQQIQHRAQGPDTPFQLARELPAKSSSEDILLASSTTIHIGLADQLTDESRDESALSAVVMALKEINRDPDLLPNHSLVLSVQDSRCDESYGTKAAAKLQDVHVRAVIGTRCSSASMSAQQLLEMYDIPQISNWATSPYLSRTDDAGDAYPFFMRTIPSDKHEAMAMADLVRYYNWTTVVTVAQNDEYGKGGISEFHKAAEGLNITVAARLVHERDEDDFSDLIKTLRDTRVFVIVVYSYHEPTSRLYEQARAQQVGGDGFVWIGASSTRLTHAPSFLTVTVWANLETARYREFVERWESQPATFDEETGECSAELDAVGEPIWRRSDVNGNSVCVGKNYSSESPNLTSVYAYDAAYVVARALHELLEVEGREEVVGAELRDAMLAQNFTGISGAVAFDSVGDRSEGYMYEVLNHVGNSSLQRVAMWSPESGYDEGCWGGAVECWEVQWSTVANTFPIHTKYAILGVTDVIYYADGTFHDLSGQITAGTRMAINEINANPHLLRNTRLYMALLDDKCDYDAGADAAYRSMNDGAIAFVGMGCSSSSEGAQSVLNHPNIPQISSGATSPELAREAGGEDVQDRFPFFMRTATSDLVQATTIADMVRYYGWTAVVTVARDDSYGRGGIAAFQEQALVRNITIVAQLTYAVGATEFSELTQELWNARAFVFVIFGLWVETELLIVQAFERGVGGDGYVWILSEASCGDSLTVEDSNLTTHELNAILRGLLCVEPFYNTSTQAYLEFAERWESQPSTLDEDTGECGAEVDAVGSPLWRWTAQAAKLTNYDVCIGGNFTIADLTHRHALAYDAAYVVARALHELLEVEGREEVVGAELRDAMLAQNFTGASGAVAFDSVGDRSEGIKYEVLNHVGNSSLQRVAMWSPESGYDEGCWGGAIECWEVQWSTDDNSHPSHSRFLLVGVALNLQLPDIPPTLSSVHMAIEELNSDSNFLPAFQLRFQLNDTKCNTEAALDSAKSFERRHVDVVLGASCSGASMSMQDWLSRDSIAQISGSATSMSLSTSAASSSDPYPYFLRTIPSDVFQVEVMAEMVAHYGWTVVATVAEDSAYATSGTDAFHDLAPQMGISIAAALTYDIDEVDFAEVVQGLLEAQVYIIVTFGRPDTTGMLMEQAYSAGVGGKGYVWIGSEATTVSEPWESMSDDLTVEEKNAIMRGFLSIHPYIDKSAPQYAEFLQRWRSKAPTIDEGTGECSAEVDAAGAPIWRRYDFDGNLTTYVACLGMNYSSQLPDAYAAYFFDAVHVAARALHELLEVEGREEVVGAELRDAMLAQNFIGISGAVAFDSVGDRSEGIKYEVLNHAGNSSLQRVAMWSPESGYDEGCWGGAIECWEVQWSTGNEGYGNAPADGQCEEGAEFSVLDSRCTPCPSGAFHNASTGICAPCPRGSVSRVEGATACEWCRDIGAALYQSLEGQSACLLCPEGADCSDGYSVVGSSGYWRDSDIRDQFYQCDKESLCTGESQVYSGPGCLEGHTGPLCMVCEQGYQRTDPFTRTECERCGAHQRTSRLQWVVLFCTVLPCFLGVLAFLYWPYIRNYVQHNRKRTAAGQQAGKADQAGSELSKGEHLALGMASEVQTQAGTLAMAEQIAASSEGADQGSATSAEAPDFGFTQQSSAHQKVEILRAMAIRNGMDAYSWMVVGLSGVSSGAVGAWEASGLGRTLSRDIEKMAAAGFGTYALCTQIMSSMISFTQVIGSFRGFDMEWPRSLRNAFALLDIGQLFSISTLDFQCDLGNQTVHSRYPIWISCVTMVIGALGLMHLATYTSLIHNSQVFRTVNFKALIFVLFFLYPIFSAKFLLLFPCRSFYGDVYMLHDLSESCDTSEHARMVLLGSLGGILLFIGGVPLFFVWCLKHFRIPYLLEEKRSDARISNLLAYFIAQPVLSRPAIELRRDEVDPEVLDIVYSHFICGDAHSLQDRCAALEDYCATAAVQQAPAATAPRLSIDQIVHRNSLFESRVAYVVEGVEGACDSGKMGQDVDHNDRAVKMSTLLTRARMPSHRYELHSPKWMLWTAIAPGKMRPIHKLECEAITQIGFLFTAYRPECWYFEIVETFRKLAFVALPVLSPDIEFQLFCSMVLCMVNVSGLHFFHPNVSTMNHNIKLFFAYVLTLNCFYGWITLAGMVSEGNETVSATVLALLNILAFTIPGFLSLLLMVMTINSMFPKNPFSRLITGRRKDSEDADNGNDLGIDALSGD